MLAGVERPIDDLEAPLGPGPHEIMFQYSYYHNYLDQLPQSLPGHVRPAYIDNVRVVPFDDTFFDGFESGDSTGDGWNFFSGAAATASSLGGQVVADGVVGFGTMANGA